VTIETRAQLFAALDAEEPQLYELAPAADVEGLALTEFGKTLCARFGVVVEFDPYGLAYAVLDGGDQPCRT
jgi:hypothetical protein